MVEKRLREKYGKIIDEGMGIVVIFFENLDDDSPHGGPISITKVIDDMNFINAFCSGALSIYKSIKGASIYVVFKNGSLRVEKYTGHPIFRNPNCCGGEIAI
ncbi:MAG: hypothetical protein PHH24_01185 [Candidatus Moranbacteria bacterium]|nr:hypothetical protein [Candidatus Moranbacteria bacterium]MDD5652027.1 hypothetical protein [Candidatus Moranbacteria bacterium]